MSSSITCSSSTAKGIVHPLSSSQNHHVTDLVHKHLEQTVSFNQNTPTSKQVSAEESAKDLVTRATESLEFNINPNKASRLLDLARDSLKPFQNVKKFDILLEIVKLRLKIDPNHIPLELGEASRTLAESSLTKEAFDQKDLEFQGVRNSIVHGTDLLKPSISHDTPRFNLLEINKKLRDLETIQNLPDKIRQLCAFSEELLKAGQDLEARHVFIQLLISNIPENEISTKEKYKLLGQQVLNDHENEHNFLHEFITTIPQNKLSTVDSGKLVQLQLRLYPGSGASIPSTLQMAEYEEIHLYEKGIGNTTRLCVLAVIYHLTGWKAKSKDLFSLAKTCRPANMWYHKYAEDLLKVAKYQARIRLNYDAIETLKSHKKYVLQNFHGIERITELRKTLFFLQTIDNEMVSQEADNILKEIENLMASPKVKEEDSLSTTTAAIAPI